MPTKKFTRLIENISTLSYTELKRTNTLIQQKLSQDEMGQVVSNRESAVTTCPHCSHQKVIKWGASKQGKQRFKCSECKKTFNALTHTPLAKMKKPDLMVEFGKLMVFAIPLRESARALGINLKTAFYWRHKLLNNPQMSKPSALKAIIEADETHISTSNKGNRKLKRKPHKRGGGKRSKTPIFIALDRQGAVTHTVMAKNTKEEIEKALVRVLTPSSVLITDGNLSYSSIVDALPFDIEHKRMIADKLNGEKAAVDGVYSIQRLNNYMMQFKGWNKRFKGVASHYLDRYLSWFRCLQDSGEKNYWVEQASHNLSGKPYGLLELA